MRPLPQLENVSTEYKPAALNQNDELKAEFGRLLHAAVVNKHFRDKLLNDPIDCIQAGYCGESFNFPFELINSIKMINAKSIEEFANHVLKMMNVPIRKEASVLL